MVQVGGKGGGGDGGGNRIRGVPAGDWTTLCQPISKWVPFSNAAKRGRLDSSFHILCPKYNGCLSPTAPKAIRLWKTFTFFTPEIIQHALRAD